MVANRAGLRAYSLNFALPKGFVDFGTKADGLRRLAGALPKGKREAGGEQKTIKGSGGENP